MKSYSEIHHNSNIVPLRWIGNFLGEYAGNHLVKAIDLDEEERHGIAYRYHATLWKVLNKPYEWWGTYYTIDLERFKESIEDGESKDPSGEIS